MYTKTKKNLFKPFIVLDYLSEQTINCKVKAKTHPTKATALFILNFHLTSHSRLKALLLCP